MKNKSILQLENLGCRIGYDQLLKDISWQVQKGEHWAVLGMNGSGKTTLLSIIAGYLPHYGGSLKVFGETYSSDNILALRKKIGFVSSSFFDKYYQNESALEIVLAGKFGAFGLDFDISNEDVIYAKQIMSKLNIGDKSNRVYKSLSKGERQNVLIARAFFAQPEILLLDEPCSGLDINARKKVLSMVEKIAKDSNVTIIYVTHYPEELLPVFENILLLRRGFIFKQGKREEILKDSLLSVFLELEAGGDDANDEKKQRY